MEVNRVHAASRIHVVFVVVALVTVASGAAGDDRVQFIPASAHNPGVGNTLRVTDARVFNPDAAESTSVRLAFLPAGADNSNVTEVEVLLEPREAAALDDVVAGLFGEAQAGAIRLRSGMDFLATAARLGAGTVTLQPLGFRQVNNVFQFVGAGDVVVRNASVELASKPAVLAYASVVDNTSGDPIFVSPFANTGTPATTNNPPQGTVDSPADDVTVDAGATDERGLADPAPDSRTVTVNPAGVTLSQVQTSIFTPQCIGCHGGSDPTSDLNLEAGQAHSNLVNVPATTQSGTRVVPFDPDSSVLVVFLEDGHRNLPPADIQAIRDWITAGALDN